MYSDHWVLSRVAYTHAFFMLILIINIKRKDHKETMGFLKRRVHKETMGFLIYIEKRWSDQAFYQHVFTRGSCTFCLEKRTAWQTPQDGQILAAEWKREKASIPPP